MNDQQRNENGQRSEKHPIQGVMDTAMQNIKEMVDVNTIVGEPITTPDGSVIIPVSKVGFGFASGGSDFTTKAHQNTGNPENLCFGGGSGAGVTITPVAFLVVSAKGGISLLPIEQPSFSTIDKLVEMIPGFVEKFKDMASRKDKKDSEEKEEETEDDSQ
jgi:sporulation protein YtfJ